MSNICNLDQLSAMTGGDKDVMKEFISMYLNDTPNMLKKIDDAFASNKLVGEESVAWCCHKIAPQLSYMGISEGYDLAKNVEAKLKEMSAGYPDLASNISRLNELCQQSYVELNQFINS
jgi:HPt (histidine-containing phosphotransfer) domain-containing protein